MKKLYETSLCHPDIPHHAKGLCHGCYQRKHLLTNKDNYRVRSSAYSQAATKRWRDNHPEKDILSRAKRSAKKRDLKFTLDVSDITIPDICPVLGIPIERYGKLDYAPSIDRIDNTKGYIKGNILIISTRANRLKGDGTPEELKKIAEFYFALQ